MLRRESRCFDSGVWEEEEEGEMPVNFRWGVWGGGGGKLWDKPWEWSEQQSLLCLDDRWPDRQHGLPICRHIASSHVISAGNIQ